MHIRQSFGSVSVALLLILSPVSIAHGQHDHSEDNKAKQGHLAHMMAGREQTVYSRDLPPPALMTGIGNSSMKIGTKSAKTQAYFNQGLNLLHDFWDFEAYRAFKEAIRNDPEAVMPYWGMLQIMGYDGKGGEYKEDLERAVERLKELVKTAGEHERLYAEIALLQHEKGEDSDAGITKKYETIVHKYPDDIDARLFLALMKMSGYDSESNPRDGQLYSEFILKDVARIAPDSHAFHHYWIHLKEDCCPAEALKSADVLASLAPASGHIVHMPGHIYNRVGDYKKAHDAFVAAYNVDLAYMEKEGIQEVDNWNYIHNLNYLMSNCVHGGRLGEGLLYAEKLKNMPVDKNRKNVYDSVFFFQGLLAPAKMHIAFGNWGKASEELDRIVGEGGMFSEKSIRFRDGLAHFAKGMDAVSRNDIGEAARRSDSLDAFLWRNDKQADKSSAISSGNQAVLNIASLELQGVVESSRNNFELAISLLEQAQQKEIALGYGEPPIYPRPVAYSLGAAYEKAGQHDKAIRNYLDLLERFPKSAAVYHRLARACAAKGDREKAEEYTALFKEAAVYADEGIYD